MDEATHGGRDSATAMADGIATSRPPHPPANSTGVGESALAAVLDQLPHGVFLVTADARLLFANETGRLLLEARDGLQLRRGSFSVPAPADAARLRALLQGCAAAPEHPRSATRAGMALPRRRGRPLLLVAVGLGAAVSLFVSDPDDEAPLSATLLDALFGLTPAEVKLTLALLHGHGLDWAAQAVGISPGTAHTHLRHIFSKTGTSRQAELVRLIWASHLQTPRARLRH